MDIFSVKDFSATTWVRILQFGTKLYCDEFYCVTKTATNQSLYLFIFHSLQWKFLSQIFRLLFRVPTRQGKVREIYFIFKVREKSGNSVKWSGKLENLQKSGKSQGILKSCFWLTPQKLNKQIWDDDFNSVRVNIICNPVVLIYMYLLAMSCYYNLKPNFWSHCFNSPARGKAAMGNIKLP